MKQQNNPQALREKYIRELNGANNSALRAKELADDLFSLDLTVYSQNFSFRSIVYNSFAMSEIDENISMHPEQLQIVSKINENAATIISAPTSFGKTFCIFEYIVKYKPKNVVLIVPTLALVDEYFKKIIKKYKNKFSHYKIHTSLNEEKIYNFNSFNIFILTHDRVVQETNYHIIEKIDFLVIDEVYKLETDMQNDRVLVLNMAYYYLSKKASKYVLLAPFIKEVNDIDKLEKSPVFYGSNYSPVVNDVRTFPILQEQDRVSECKRILKSLNEEEKTLIYFPTVSSMYKYISTVIALEPKKLKFLDHEVLFFIEWAKEEIHEEWCLITALERGYLIHNGQIPMGTRMFQLDYYEQSNLFNKLLCTSTLLEGVNTTAKNIIITKPSRISNSPGDHFSAFDFFNLVGRTGRLHQHYIGDAYYIKSPSDPEYRKADAVKSIRFEVTDASKDIDIQKGEVEKYQDVVEFLKKLNITKEDYLANIGSKARFDTVIDLYNAYAMNKTKLLAQLQAHIEDGRVGRLRLVEILYKICEQKEKVKLESNLINTLLSKKRPRIKKVVDDAKKYFKIDIDYLIAKAIMFKTSYIEHNFYSRVLIIKYFLERE
ncbi:DEAD/DEAH box helicase, partial [Bacillus pacificus]|uniref:DEAD/DEAH box helicase n=6 Tax=Bacillaceae TaxID=186817 RepID=UPI002D79C739